MISSGPPVAAPPWPSDASAASAAPKPSHKAGPAQVTLWERASKPSCSAVKSLNPTQRVPRSTERAISRHGRLGSRRVRP